MRAEDLVAPVERALPDRVMRLAASGAASQSWLMLPARGGRLGFRSFKLGARKQLEAFDLDGIGVEGVETAKAVILEHEPGAACLASVLINPRDPSQAIAVVEIHNGEFVILLEGLYTWPTPERTGPLLKGGLEERSRRHATTGPDISGMVTAALRWVELRRQGVGHPRRFRPSAWFRSRD